MDEIQKRGGWVNAHVHTDRAFTITPDKLSVYEKYVLEDKWDIVDEVKKDASVDEYYGRISKAIELMISAGVKYAGSFIDIDPVAEDRAIKGALKAREHYKDQITIKYINQTLKGVIEKEARKWFEIGAEYVDIIGGLPGRDRRDYGQSKEKEHVDILMEKARSMKKMVHIHVDQFNRIEDKQTEMVADKTVEYGMEGRVVCIHSISLAAHPKEYRMKVYKKLKDAGVMVIACPSAWIDSRRNENLVPSHNSLTPVDEMIPAGISVAVGSDNLADYMLPFCDGDMWFELRLLAMGNRFLNIEELIKIATVNGKKVLGILH